MWHLYILPIIKDDTPLGEITGTPRPKYLVEFGVAVAVYRYGEQGWCMAAADVSDDQDISIRGNSDVIKLPDNLDQQIGAGALATVKARLESVGIPSGWVTGGMTYRGVLRIVAAMFTFMQRFKAVTKVRTAFISGAVTLDTQFNSLGATARQHVLDTAANLKLDTTGFTGASTMRQILKGVADQLGSKQITLQGIII